jgi:hypothetical protein
MGVEVLKLTGVKHMVMMKLEETVQEDYISIENKTLGPESSCSLIRSRRNGVLRVKRCAPIHDFTDITYITHPDIATIYSIYGAMSGYVFVEEYLELRLVDLLPLTEIELASATSQVRYNRALNQTEGVSPRRPTTHH